jgi:hypothetical protein
MKHFHLSILSLMNGFLPHWTAAHMAVQPGRALSEPNRRENSRLPVYKPANLCYFYTISNDVSTAVHDEQSYLTGCRPI